MSKKATKVDNITAKIANFRKHGWKEKTKEYRFSRFYGATRSRLKMSVFEHWCHLANARDGGIILLEILRVDARYWATEEAVDLNRLRWLGRAIHTRRMTPWVHIVRRS